MGKVVWQLLDALLQEMPLLTFTIYIYVMLIMLTTLVLFLGNKSIYTDSQSLCSGFHWDVYRYQSVSHSVQWFSLRRILVSAYLPLCTVLFTMSLISVSAHITLCAMVLTMRRISVSAYIALCAVVYTMRLISVSAYIALCAVVYTMRLIAVSAHSTLWTSHYETYISIKPYHTNMYSGFHYETYIAINPYRSILVIWTAMYDCYVMSDRIEWE